MSRNYKVPRSERKLADYPPGTKWALKFEYCDLGGPFAWPTDNQTRIALFGYLGELNVSQDLHEITTKVIPGHFDSMHHYIDSKQLNPIALERLEMFLVKEEFSQIYRDELFCLRVCARPNSPERIWCILIEKELYPIWWDPNHKVWSSGKYSVDSGRSICNEELCIHDKSLIN